MTENQLRIWSYLVGMKSKDVIPTVRDISSETGLSYGAITHSLSKFQRLGWINRWFNRPHMHISLTHIMIPKNVYEAKFELEDLDLDYVLVDEELVNTIPLSISVKDNEGNKHVEWVSYSVVQLPDCPNISMAWYALHQFDTEKVAVITSQPYVSKLAILFGYNVCFPPKKENENE